MIGQVVGGYRIEAELGRGAQATVYRATQLALGERGPSYTERDSRAFAGATDPEVFRILGIVFDLEASTDQLVQRKREHMTALVRVEGRPLAGVPEMPMRLREAGLRLGIV